MTRGYTITLTDSEYDAMKERIRNLEDALREAMCPSAMIDNKDETVGYCVEHNQCGCGMNAMGLCHASENETKP